MRTHWLVALALYASVVSASDLSCTALVYDQTGSDLYLGDAAGTAPLRLTSDGRTKFGASLSPRGDYASFVYEKSNTEIQVVSREGNMRTLVIDDRFDHMGAPLIATQWDSESLVMVQFYGHANSLFQWVGVGKGVAPSNVPNGAAGSELRMSTYCASAPEGRHVACVAGDGVLIDDRSGISIDSFEDGRTIGTFDVAEAEKTAVPGYEGASFTVIRVRPEGTSYRAGLGESQPEIFLPDNDGGLVERIGDSTWGEFRVVSHHEGSARGNGGARIVVRALDAEELPEFVGLAWTNDGSMLAALRRKPGAISEVVLVRQRSPGQWQFWKRLTVNSDAIGGRIKFIDASTLFMRGAGTESAVFAIRKDRLEKLKSLPNQIDAGTSTDGLANIEDWSCVRH